MIRQLRLASGLVMLAYVTTHFVNHSLGLISVQAMDRALVQIYQYWASPLGGVLLYGAFAIHYSLALWALSGLVGHLSSITISTALLALAFIAFVASAVGWRYRKVNLIAVGLALWMLSLIIT